MDGYWMMIIWKKMLWHFLCSLVKENRHMLFCFFQVYCAAEFKLTLKDINVLQGGYARFVLISVIPKFSRIRL